MNAGHTEKLRKMLEQVDPSGQARGLRDTLESRTASPAIFESLRGPGESVSLDVGHAQRMAELESAMALESLDLLVEGREIDTEHRFALEAIVLPYHRPVVDIVDNRMKTEQLTQTWNHLVEPSLRGQIEQCFLSIGRINVPSLPSLPYAGTGFIVGDGVLMTNRHVAAIFAEGLGERTVQFQTGHRAVFDFYHESGQSTSESLKVEDVLMIHPYWDMALLQVSGLPERRKPLALSTADPATLVDRTVVVVGYPGYDPTGDDEFQRIQNRVFRGTYYVKRLQPGLFRVRRPVESFEKMVEAVTHDCSTLGGNSGSAVLLLPDEPGEPIEVVGLHFAGQYLEANFAVSPHDLASDSRVVDSGVNFVGRVEPRRDFYGPIWTRTDPESPPGLCAAAGGPAQSPAHGVTVSAAVAGGSTTVTIPLEVKVTVGEPHVARTPAAAVVPKPAEGVLRRRRPVPAAEALAKFRASSLAATSFDWQTALSLALASQLSYESPSVVMATARDSWGLTSCEFVEADDTQCFVAASMSAVLVAFRGTESLGDWLGNLNLVRTTRNYGVVHRGFLGAFQVADARLRAILSEFSGHPVLLTGHSLGGALATLAAAEWQGQLRISGIYTYGQPAVGKGSFPAFITQHYAGTFYRFVNDDDIVARVPPTYRHVGRLFHFDADGELRHQTESVAREMAGAVLPLVAPSPEEPRMMTEAEFDAMRAQLLAQRAQARVSGMESLEGPMVEGIVPSVRDHSLELYIAKIAAAGLND
jgi:V8-like Glu-specific endopeptidase